jgi:mannose-1-phosphate guanylyltransferase
MKAMILAAGRGTRVRPLTETLPKPMIPIIHKPVMEMIVDHLKSYEFDEIMVNTSYLATQIEDYFRDGQRFGVRMAYSFEGHVENGVIVDSPVGSAGAIQKIQQHSGFFDDDFVVVCGDAVIDLDLQEMLRFHREKKALATVALKRMPKNILFNYGVAVLDSQGRINSFQEKPKLGTELSDLANVGVYIFSKKIFEHIPVNTVYDIGSELLPSLAKAGGAIYGLEMPMNWLDIGRLSDYYQAVMLALKGEAPPSNLPGKEVKPGVRIGPNVRIDFEKVKISGPVYIGGSSNIGDGAVIVGPVMIGANAVIEPGAHIEESIILDHTRVSGFASYVHKVVAANFCTDPEGNVLNSNSTDTDWLFSDARSFTNELNEEQELLKEQIQILQNASI